MALELNITYEDIEAMLRAFPLDDISTSIDSMVAMEAAVIQTVIHRIGIYDMTLVSASVNSLLYYTCRLIVILRVTAEMMVGFSHEYGKAASRREQKANELESRLIAMPEEFLDEFDPTIHMGAMGYASLDEGICMRGFASWLGISWSEMMGA